MEPSLAQLQRRLTKLLPLASQFESVGFRSSSPKYANETDLLTGEGSKRFGGRWNPIGIAVVYLSITPETAMSETLAHHRYFGISIANAMPRTFVAIEVDLNSVLDFRDGRIRQRLQVSEDRILSVDWRAEVQSGRLPITQQIGQAAFEVGLEGILVPSAVDHQGHNLLIFPGNMQANSRIQIQQAARLKE